MVSQRLHDYFKCEKCRQIVETDDIIVVEEHEDQPEIRMCWNCYSYYNSENFWWV